VKESAFHNVVKGELVDDIAEIVAELGTWRRNLDASVGSPILVNPGVQSHLSDGRSHIRVRDQCTEEGSKIAGLNLEAVWQGCFFQLRLSLDEVLEQPGLSNLAHITGNLAELAQGIVVDLARLIVELKMVDYDCKYLGWELKLSGTLAIVGDL